MNRQEAAQILAILKAGYPNNYKNLSQTDAQGIVSLWSMQFTNISADVVFMALNKAISGCAFPPTIADVKGKMESLYWEAYEALELNRWHKNLSEAQKAAYERICAETDGCRRQSMEPSIGTMLPNRGVKQIEG